MNTKPLRLVLLLSLALGLYPAMATAARAKPLARDPHTPGYVEAKELPDGEVAPINADGNFILGPTHHRARKWRCSLACRKEWSTT